MRRAHPTTQHYQSQQQIWIGLWDLPGGLASRLRGIEPQVPKSGWGCSIDIDVRRYHKFTYDFIFASPWLLVANRYKVVKDVKKIIAGMLMDRAWLNIPST